MGEGKLATQGTIGMVGDFREKLVAALAPENPKLLFYARGSKHPPYNQLPVKETLGKFCAEFLPLSPIIDPRQKPIAVVKGNFPKLAGLKHKTLSREDYPARKIVAAIENGTFDAGDYVSGLDDRIKTLFWLPELLRDPDAIYRNAHKIVAGDEVYVRVYDKMGSSVKLAFTMDLKRKGEIIRTVVITSFLTDPATAASYVKGKPLYARPK